jgi:hypothetical protein
MTSQGTDLGKVADDLSPDILSSGRGRFALAINGYGTT